MVNLLTCALWIASFLKDDEGPLPTPGALWHSYNWTWEPSIIVPLVLLFAWYLTGMIRRPGIYGLLWRHAAFFAGWIALFFALVSPLHRLGDVLFSAHMLQHEILLLIAAPLMAASHPSVTMLYALPLTGRQSTGRFLSRIERTPIMATLLSAFGAFLFHAIALWTWHIPFLYQATLQSDWIHALQHLSFFLSGLFFWSALYGAGRSSMTYGAGVLYVFGTAVHCSALGALLTFSTVLWYPIYSERTQLWHLTPLQDQQLGGLLMWVPSGVVFIVIGIWMFARWLAVSDQRLQHTSLHGEILERKEYL